MGSFTFSSNKYLTNASRGTVTRGVSSPIEPRWFRLLCLSLVVMRCQPLRRALCSHEETWTFIVKF
ncbi:exlusion protein FxsA [Vibrio cholerae]|nr:exlusion protein FxsA [Vibrio cholerae]